MRFTNWEVIIALAQKRIRNRKQNTNYSQTPIQHHNVAPMKDCVNKTLLLGHSISFSRRLYIIIIITITTVGSTVLVGPQPSYEAVFIRLCRTRHSCSSNISYPFWFCVKYPLQEFHHCSYAPRALPMQSYAHFTCSHKLQWTKSDAKSRS
jgi:hypothetical protein